jgi:glucose-1-phosphate adenylyltransferase
VVFAECSIGEGSSVEGSLILPRAKVGRNCRLKNVIVDGGCTVPDGTVIGTDPVADSVAYDVSLNGIVLVTAQRLARGGGAGVLPVSAAAAGTSAAKRLVAAA